MEHQSEARLIAGQLKEVGVRTRLEIGDMGVYEAMVWNYDGDEYAPDYDLFVSGWDGYFDPGQTLSTFTAAQIEGWNEAVLVGRRVRQAVRAAGDHAGHRPSGSSRSGACRRSCTRRRRRSC